ncbi:MAG: two-component system phosphate regulon sensor histidine kinase PhoR [Patescibacteria group bacterium]|jgi:two-component system phosphate regulon sensor histidine kinase PhoR
MNNNTIKKVILLGAIAIMGILAIQTYWVMNTWDLNEDEFEQKVHLALLNVAKSMVELRGGTLPDDVISRPKMSNYYIVNLENEIDANELEYYLKREFQDLGMAVNFEYAIHDCSTNEMVYGKYISFTEETIKDLNLGELPTYKDLTYYFGVKFPDRSAYLLGKMQLSVFFSLILLFTIIFFMYAIFVILRQQRLSEMQKDFINNMTHEFKTPISTIKISSEVFLKNPLIQNNQRLHRYAQIIKEQNERLNDQVEKVLQLAKIERESFKLYKEDANLHQILEPILDSTQIIVTDYKGKLKMELLADQPVVFADKLHLTNIVHNLLDNAIKYHKNIPDIIVKTENMDGQLSLSIIDKGIGIKKEYQQKILTKFFRVPTGNVHNVKGFGLGLYYVKNVCDAHGWRIQVDSKLNEGTEIKIVLN